MAAPQPTPDQARATPLGFGSQPAATVGEVMATPGGPEWLRRVRGFQAVTPAVRAAIAAVLDDSTPFPGGGAA
jgi:hypothetical protein